MNKYIASPSDKTEAIRYYNLDIVDYDNLSDKWEMPILKRTTYVPEKLIGFNYAKTYSDKTVGVHFFIDDYQFARVWNRPQDYLNVLMPYDCIFSPDFSIYDDMPTAVKIWNIYRSRLIGAYYQDKGLRVIPTIEWSDAVSYNYAFEGVEKGSTVAISPVSCKKDPVLTKQWKDGVDEMIARLEPSTIIVYDGKDIDHDYKGIPVVHFKNERIERMRESIKAKKLAEKEK